MTHKSGLRVCGFISTIMLAVVSFGTAEAFDEPMRGSPMRKAIMDGLRPTAERAYGTPIEFVVKEIRVGNGVAFVKVEAQRPGGGIIELARTPLHRREGVPLDLINEPSTEALMVKIAGQWKPVHFANAATDVWWANTEYCPIFSDVLPEICWKK